MKGMLTDRPKPTSCIYRVRFFAILATGTKRSFAGPQEISRRPVIRVTNCPSGRARGFGPGEGFGKVRRDSRASI